MILVTVGTHELPFDRLVEAAERLGASGAEEVVLQFGTSRRPHASVARALAYLSPGELAQERARARVVVTHAGTASVLEALEEGIVPIVVPRSPGFGEHVDGHQIAFARRMEQHAHVIEDPATLERAVGLHATFRPEERYVAPDATASVAELGRLADDLTRRRRRRPALLRLAARGLRLSFLRPSRWDEPGSKF